MANNPDIQGFIQELIDGQKSAEALEKAGLLDIISSVFCDAECSGNTLRAFSLKFDNVEKRLDFAKTVLEEAQRRNAPDVVQNALMSYIFRMTPVVNRKCRKSVFSGDYTVNKVSTPESEHQYRWVSTVRSDIKPKKNERVLVCGYWYAGVIEYGVARWTGNEWVCPFDTDPVREFVILYWCCLPPLPVSAEDEV